MFAPRRALATFIALAAALVLAPAGGAEADAPAVLTTEPAFPEPRFIERAGQVLPPWADLDAADTRGDEGRLAHSAARIGLGRLARTLTLALTDPLFSPRHQAALRGALTLAGVERLLPTFTALLAHPDDRVARLGVAGVGAVLIDAAPNAHLTWETAPDAIARACAALGPLARDHARQAATRLDAAITLGASTRCPDTSRVIRELLTDDVAEIRRAAALSTRATNDGLAVPALLTALGDADPRVSSAATARLCRLFTATPIEPTTREAWLMSAERFAPAPGASPADVIEILDCAATLRDPALAAESTHLFALATRSSHKVVRQRAGERAGRKR